MPEQLHSSAVTPHDPFAPQLDLTPQLALSFEEPQSSRRIWPVRELVAQVRELVEQDMATSGWRAKSPIFAPRPPAMSISH